MTLFKIRAVTCGKNLLKLAVSASRTMLVWGLYLLNIAVEVVGVCESPGKKVTIEVLSEMMVCVSCNFPSPLSFMATRV